MKLRKEHKLFLVLTIALFIVALATIMAGNVIYSVIVFCVFFILVMALSYLNYANAKRLEDAQKAIIYALANLAEWRDIDTGMHLERTRNYGIILAKELSKDDKFKKIINKDFIDNLYYASPLHDIGKVGISDAILLKEGKLTEEEYGEMKRHVIIAKNILTEIINKFGKANKYFTMCLNIAAYHHEKYDGTGYAEGLKGDEIYLEARIYALCDVYDAIRSKRPYKEEKSHEDTVSIIKDLKGTFFDPDIVDAFLRCHHKFMEVYETYSILTESKEIKDDTRNTNITNIQWSDKLSVGVQVIDNQHKELIKLINVMISSILKGEGEDNIAEAISFLDKYIIVHFNTEEQLMIESSYPQYGLHIKQHLYFIDKFNSLKTRFNNQEIDAKLLIDLNKEIIQWLVNHIYKSDKQLGEYLSKNNHIKQ